MRAFAFVALTLSAAAAFAADQDLAQLTPAFKNASDAADPKHQPLIEAPEKVKPGEFFPLTVTIGAGALHPSLAEHHVRFIAVYRMGTGAIPIEITRVYLHPVYSMPKVTFWLALDESAELLVAATPTHAAEFFAKRKITVAK